MGDMADYALEQVMDAEEDRFRFCSGGMGEQEAYDLGIIDELGYYNHPPMFAQPTASRSCKSCKYCGKTKLHWVDTNNGGRLANFDGEIHNCEQHKFEEST